MKRSTACGPAAKGRRVSSFCCVRCRGLSLHWFDCVNLMHVCGLLLHGISGISTLPRGFLKCTCLFVTFRVNLTSVLLHHEHLNYKLTLSVANTYATFCSIHLALPMEVWMTTSNSVLHIIAVSNLLWSFLWNRHVAFVFSSVSDFSKFLVLFPVRRHWCVIWVLEMFFKPLSCQNAANVHDVFANSPVVLRLAGMSWV